MLIACFVGGPVVVAIMLMQWWLLVIAAIAATIIALKHIRDRRRRKTPKLTIACDQCGYPLDLIPASEFATEGLVVTRPTCPECGSRKL
jgi:DNA-directed RNA polymerase subunit RPC12/RpoP